MEEIVATLSENGVAYGINLVAALAIFFIGKWLVSLAAKIITKILTRARIDKTLVTFVGHLITMIGLAFVIIAAVNKLGVETTSIVAMLGAAGLAVGLALQGSLANFAAGVVLIVLQPFKVGDVVEIDGHVGTVKELQIFNTIIHTLDNRRLIFPNGK